MSLEVTAATIALALLIELIVWRLAAVNSATRAALAAPQLVALAALLTLAQRWPLAELVTLCQVLTLVAASRPKQRQARR